MATKSSTPVRKAGRSLAWLGAIMLILGGVIAGNVLWGSWDATPKLALDLEGGTQIILEPLVVEGQDVTAEQLEQAVAIIRQRVDATGVSEAEIGILGNNTVVAIPGEPDQATLDRLQASAKLEFRAVLLADAASNSVIGDGTDADGDGTPDPTDSATATPEPTATPEATPTVSPTDGSDLSWITPELQEQFNSFDCSTLSTAATNVAPQDEPLITCDDLLSTKFILGPVEYLEDADGDAVLDGNGDRQYLDGGRVTNATAGIKQNSSGVTTGEWAVYITFDGPGTTVFADVTGRLVGYTDIRNSFAIVLDGKVISYPGTNSAITDGRPEISGGFVQDTAQTLANLSHSVLDRKTE